jgi:hypothetical protein
MDLRKEKRLHFSHGLPGGKTFLRLTHGCTAHEKWDEAMSPEGSVPSLLRQVGLSGSDGSNPHDPTETVPITSLS